MQDILRVTQAAMEQDAARLKHIAMNVANASTPGYRRQVHTGHAIGTFDQVMAQSHVGKDAAARQPAMAPVSELMVAVQAGRLQKSERALDMALTGPGYFVVKTPAGIAYTRNGQFKRDEAGRLVTIQGGHTVQGTGGDVLLKGEQAVMNAQGFLKDAGDESSQGQQLLIQQFPSTVELTHAESGLLRLARPEALSELPIAKALDGQSVRQFQLEGSNVDGLQETLDTMATMRHFEALHRLTQAVDDMLGTSIKKLGEL